MHPPLTSSVIRTNTIVALKNLLFLMSSMTSTEDDSYKGLCNATPDALHADMLILHTSGVKCGHVHQKYCFYCSITENIP